MRLMQYFSKCVTKLEFEFIVVDQSSVKRGAVAGSHLQVCEYQQTTCCSAEMESTLKTRGRGELLRAIADRIVLAKQTFLSRAAKFDGSSRSLKTVWMSAS